MVSYANPPLKAMSRLTHAACELARPTKFLASLNAGNAPNRIAPDCPLAAKPRMTIL